MERCCINGDGLRPQVDIFQHHVAFTAHPLLVALHGSWEPRWFRLGGARSLWQLGEDCFALPLCGQQSMSAHGENVPFCEWEIPSRQTMRSRAMRVITIGLWASGLWAWGLFTSVEAQLYDALDAYPPRWQLASSDCNARVIEQDHLVNGGVNGRACETITFTAGHGTEVQLLYPIEPVRAIDDLTASLAVMSAREGCQIGLRVRFPYLPDPDARSPVAAVIYATSYKDAGKFARIGIGLIERPLRLKMVALRSEHGARADLRDPYVDAVVINAYSGPGTTSLRMDELRVDGMIPIGSLDPDVGERERRSETGTSVRSRRLDNTVGLNPDSESWSGSGQGLAFPLGRVTRILQHNGEPLAWVRSLGFDAVLLAEPPTNDILREAIRAQVAIYAPPPTAPDPQQRSLLDPVAGWYLGSDQALDRQHLDQATLTSQRLRELPTLWQRPILAAPAEAFREYAPLVDAMIYDLPIRCRGISAAEELADTSRTWQQIGGRIETAVGIASMPPESAIDQVTAIASSIGAPPLDNFRWHAMWLQAIRCLETAPKAILFRSTRTLASGSPLDSQRAMALSYVNRMIAMIAPWVAGASAMPPPSIVPASEGRIARYRCGKLVNGQSEVLLLGTTATRHSEVLSGDGETLEIALTPADANKLIWRLTHFSAERLTPVQTNAGPRLQIVSPDVVEIIVISSDPSVGGLLSLAAGRFARQAVLDRWQLTSEQVQQTSQNWQIASASRAVETLPPTDLISIALQTLRDAEPRYRAGEIEASLRMARRADAWALRSDWQLSEALMPDWPQPTSCPPILCGATAVQTAWSPLMRNQGWGNNRLTSGSLDSESLLQEGRWTFGRRQDGRAESEIAFVNRGVFSGAGALRVSVQPLAGRPLPGGYEGTVVQVRSPGVRIPAGTAIRIEAMVRTLGFGGPHQGLLVYDTIAGQELGLLVRGRSEWTPVRLYRQTLQEGEVHVMFEILGAGEAMIDEVQLRIWEPQHELPFRMTPMARDSEVLDPEQILFLGENADPETGLSTRR